MKSQIKKMLLLELGIIILVLIIYLVVKLNIVSIIPACIINKTFGILCPSCGGTRCIINFINGNFIESFIYHPIFFITIIYLLIVNALYIFNTLTNKKILECIYPKLNFWIVFIIVILIFTIIRNVF